MDRLENPMAIIAMVRHIDRVNVEYAVARKEIALVKTNDEMKLRQRLVANTVLYTNRFKWN